MSELRLEKQQGAVGGGAPDADLNFATERGVLRPSSFHKLLVHGTHNT